MSSLVVFVAQEVKLANDAEKAHEAYKQSLADLNAYQKKFEADMRSLLARLQVRTNRARFDCLDKIFPNHFSRFCARAR